MRVNIGKTDDKKLTFELNSLRRHSIILGTTGSGKTVMAKVLLEEAMIRNIPVIAIDPKGDIGSLGITNKSYDFRPFSGAKRKSESIARKYMEAGARFDLSKQDLAKLSQIKTDIYTPKSDLGKQVSLTPSLLPPKKVDPEFVETISESLLTLAKIKNEKLKSIVSTIILAGWKKKKHLTIERIINQVVTPPFSKIGSLDIDDFMKLKERQKHAASLNLLLSSPALRAWEKGEKLDIAKMLKKGRLSVFDMRFANEKQFVTEQILVSLYRHLLSLGGTRKLRAILYIDELAGLLPLPPSNPPCKKMLEILIRQARAFGLGIVVATQSPGDVDYRILGNIGTRFVGKLRTERDIEKVATAMDLSASELRSDISALKTGDFVFNDAVKNRNVIMKARWLYSFHQGPLSGKQIGWVNDKAPKPEGKLDVKIKPTIKKMSAQELIIEIDRPKKKTIVKDKKLTALVKSVKLYSAKSDLKIKIGYKEYTPYLRLLIEPRGIKGLELETFGPQIFDLTGKILPVHKRLNNVSWSSYIEEGISIRKTKNIKRYFDYFLKEAKDSLKTKYFQSTILDLKSTDREDIEQKNFNYIMDNARLKIRQYDAKCAKAVRIIETKISKNKGHITKYKARLTSSKAKRMIKRIFVSRRVSHTTKEHRILEKKINKLTKENIRLREKIGKTKINFGHKKDSIQDKAYSKAHTCVKTKNFIPKKDDLPVQATLLLLPK